MQYCGSFECFIFLQDLLNFEDPLNVEAAEHYARDKVHTLFPPFEWD